MPSLLIAFTQDTGAREDANLYYTRYAKVSSDTLDFSEDVFKTRETRLSREQLKAFLEEKGYVVEEQRVTIVVTDESDDE